MQNCSRSIVEELRALPRDVALKRLALLTPEEQHTLYYTWEYWARNGQLLPANNANPRTVDGSWVYWLLKAGRGYGKTRAGAETIRKWARDFRFVNLIGATVDDARDIMIEGESGILACCSKDERPVYKASARRLQWPNGASSLIFTADEPERLRGKQHQKLWCDEIAAWRYPDSWDQAKFGLRLGPLPQAVITSTPRPSKLIKELMADPSCIITNGTTYENKGNLAASFYTDIIKKYEGSRLGRQELMAEILDDNPNALWKRKDIDNYRAAINATLPDLVRIVVGVDPAVTSFEGSDYTGIIVAGMTRGETPHYYVLNDLSLIGTPHEWASCVAGAYKTYAADRVVAEVNNGGDLVEVNLRTVDPNISYLHVHASRGKTIRAEPIAALYEQGRVHHVGTFPLLEDQLCDFDPLTVAHGKSPDRMDALVWAISSLMNQEIEAPASSQPLRF